MQDPSAEIRELGRLVISDFGDCACAGHYSWIGRQKAIYVRPDDDFVRIESSTQDRRGII